MPTDNLKLSDNLNTEEFYSRIEKRYKLFDENGEQYLCTINSLIFDRKPLTDIKAFMLQNEVQITLGIANEYISLLNLLKISEAEESVGEKPFLRCASNIDDLLLIDKTAFLYLLRIEFDFEKEDYIKLADHIAESGISALYLAQTVTSGNFKRPVHLLDTLIDILSEKGHTVTAMKLSALKEHYLG